MSGMAGGVGQTTDARTSAPTAHARSVSILLSLDCDALPSAKTGEAAVSPIASLEEHTVIARGDAIA